MLALLATEDGGRGRCHRDHRYGRHTRRLRNQGTLVDGPVVDWMDGPVIEPGYLTAISQAHDDGGFDRFLVGYGAVGPEGWAVASSVLELHHI